MYEDEVNRSATARGVKIINIIRAMLYFLVVGVQVVHCSTEAVTCGVMIVLVPLVLGVMDALLIWGSGRDSTGVRIGALALSIISLWVAAFTIGPFFYGLGLTTNYHQFMFLLSFAVIVMSIIEFVVVVYDLMSPKESLDELRLPSSIRTYEN